MQHSYNLEKTILVNTKEEMEDISLRDRVVQHNPRQLTACTSYTDYTGKSQFNLNRKN